MPCRKLVSQTLVKFSPCSSLAPFQPVDTSRFSSIKALRLRKERATTNLAYAAVGVFEAYYVFLVELSKGNLQDAYRFITYRR